MSIITLDTFKGFLRELSTDLDVPLQLALDAGEAEASAFLGVDIATEYATVEPPPDIVMGILYLARVHADEGDAERYRSIGQKLLQPYRVNTGFGNIGSIAA